MVSFLCKDFGKKTIQEQCPKSLLFVDFFFFKYIGSVLVQKKKNNEVENLTELDFCYER